MSEHTAVLARIAGRVQGVGFRAFVAGEARELGLVGWVRNEPDGTVAALVAGPREAVRRMEAALRRGPPGARVSSVETSEDHGEPWPERFEVRR